MPRDHRAGHDTAWSVWNAEGHLPVVMIHCSLAHHQSLKPLAHALPKQARIIAFDMPGHGASADWSGQGDFQTLTADIGHSFVGEHAGKMHLVGHSFGGTVALRMIVDRPEKIASLTLIEPVFFAAARADDPATYAEHRTEFAPFSTAMETGDMTEAARVFTRFWGTGQPWANLPEAIREDLTHRIHLIPAGAPAIEDDIHNILARLEKVTCPVNLISGENSPPIVRAIHAALAARIPHAKQHQIAGAGHMVPLSHPKEVAACVAFGSGG